jgi:hypothetical protein
MRWSQGRTKGTTAEKIVISSCAKVRGKPRDQTTVDTCLPTNLPPQITDEVRVSSDWVYKLRKNIEAFCHRQSLSLPLRISRVLSFKH